MTDDELASLIIQGCAVARPGDTLVVAVDPEPPADGEHDVTAGQFELDPATAEAASRFGFGVARRVDQDVAQGLGRAE